jgi:BON domain-containing protein
MHRDYEEDDRSWSRSADDVELWGREMDHADWLRGSYANGNGRRGPGAWIPREVRRSNYAWRSPEYAWPRREWDNRHWHGHTPMRGWQRTDERIREDVCGYLSAHPGIDTTDMEVSVANGEVTLEGTVDERFEKRMAEDLTEAVPGVRDVHNRLRVAMPERT